MEYLLYLVGLGVILYLIHLYFLKRNEKESKLSKKVVLRIKANKENEKSAKAAEQVFSSLHSVLVEDSLINSFLGKKSPRFSFEIACVEEEIFFYVWCPSVYKKLISSQIYSQFQDIEILEIKDYCHLKSKKANICAEIGTTESYIYPIKRYTQFEDSGSGLFLDPMSGLTASFSSIEKDEQLWAQVIVSPVCNSWRKRGLWAAKKISGGFRLDSSGFASWYTNMLLNTGMKGFLNLMLIRPLLFIFGLGPKHQEESGIGTEVEHTHNKETLEQGILGKLSQLGFETNIRLVYFPNKTNEMQVDNKIKELCAPFYQFNIPRFNGFEIKNTHKNLRPILKRYSERKIKSGFILNTEELATIWHLPNDTVATPKIQWAGSKKFESPVNLPVIEGEDTKDITVLGESDFRGTKKLFGIKEVDRRRHVYIIGKTGMGKSTILENMILSDIENDKGVAIIDPHGDLADSILENIPKNRTNQVLVFDPSDSEHPVSFNMFECSNPKQRHLVASGLLGVFKKIFGDSWGPRLEHILRNTCLALTEYPGATMLGIMKMLTDNTYRQKVLRKVTDPMVLSFWNDEFGKWDPRTAVDNVAPIQNKVGQFLSSSLIRNIFGQPKSSVDLRFAMDKKKIIIINLSKGKIGEDNSSLLGSMMITKFQLDAMSRADIEVSKREDFYLYVDEFQNFATDSFATILSEARKYKLNLTMANQYIDQMSDEVKSAIFGNIGTLITCQLGAIDAEEFSRQFSEKVSANDIVQLPKYKCYLNLLIDGIPSGAFSANTLPPPKSAKEKAAKQTIIDLSRERYAKKRDFVESKINKWMKNPT